MKDKKNLIILGVSLVVVVIIVAIVLIFTNTKNGLIGKWQTTYELGTLGTVTQTFEFKKDGKCKKTLKTDLLIELDCTYTIKNNKINFIYENDQKSEMIFEKEKDGYMIGGFLHKKQK